MTAQYLRPLNWSMQKKRPHDWPSTTARLAFNDRTIELQRPHNLSRSTARFRRPVRMSFQRLEIPLEEVK